MSYMSPLDKYTLAVVPLYNDLDISPNYNEPLADIFDLFEQTGMYSKNLYAFKPTREQSSAYYAAASRIPVGGRQDYMIEDYNFISYGQDLVYEPGSDEFLMLASSTYLRGIKLSDEINSYGSLYSPFVLRIMQEVGYATPAKPQMIEFFISRI